MTDPTPLPPFKVPREPLAPGDRCPNFLLPDTGNAFHAFYERVRRDAEAQKVDEHDRCDAVPGHDRREHRADDGKRQHHAGVGKKQQADRQAEAQRPEGRDEPLGAAIGHAPHNSIGSRQGSPQLLVQS